MLEWAKPDITPPDKWDSNINLLTISMLKHSIIRDCAGSTQSITTWIVHITRSRSQTVRPIFRNFFGTCYYLRDREFSRRSANLQYGPSVVALRDECARSRRGESRSWMLAHRASSGPSRHARTSQRHRHTRHSKGRSVPPISECVLNCDKTWGLNTSIHL